MVHPIKKICKIFVVLSGLLMGLFFLADTPVRVSAQSSVLTVTPLTWNIIGLDSNSPATGPKDFPVGRMSVTRELPR